MNFDWVALKPLRRDESQDLSQDSRRVANQLFSPVSFGKGQRKSPWFQVGLRDKAAAIVQTHSGLAFDICRWITPNGLELTGFQFGRLSNVEQAVVLVLYFNTKYGLLKHG